MIEGDRESGNIARNCGWEHGLLPGCKAWRQMLAFIKRKLYKIS